MLLGMLCDYPVALGSLVYKASQAAFVHYGVSVQLCPSGTKVDAYISWVQQWPPAAGSRGQNHVLAEVQEVTAYSVCLEIPGFFA